MTLQSKYFQQVIDELREKVNPSIEGWIDFVMDRLTITLPKVPGSVVLTRKDIDDLMHVSKVLAFITDTIDEPLLQLFEFQHLKSPLREVSEQFHNLAHKMVHTLVRNPERTTMLRKLREAKDCAITAMLWKDRREMHPEIFQP